MIEMLNDWQLYPMMQTTPLFLKYGHIERERWTLHVWFIYVCVFLYKQWSWDQLFQKQEFYPPRCWEIYCSDSVSIKSRGRQVSELNVSFIIYEKMLQKLYDNQIYIFIWTFKNAYVLYKYSMHKKGGVLLAQALTKRKVCYTVIKISLIYITSIRSSSYKYQHLHQIAYFCSVCISE